MGGGLGGPPRWSPPRAWPLPWLPLPSYPRGVEEMEPSKIRDSVFLRVSLCQLLRPLPQSPRVGVGVTGGNGLVQRHRGVRVCQRPYP